MKQPHIQLINAGRGTYAVALFGTSGTRWSVLETFLSKADEQAGATLAAARAYAQVVAEDLALPLVEGPE